VSIEQDLQKKLTAAIRAKDLTTANCIRMVKTKVMERRTAKGFSGEVDDALYLDVIAAYSKSLEKGCKEFANAGEKGQAQVAEMQFEIAYLKQFLPAQMSEEEAREAVKAAISELGVSDAKQAGRVMGHVMKTHKGLIDGGVVKKLVSELLGGG
jgi:uncharacterized protein YqeY